LYEPVVENSKELNEQYKRGNWYLPAVGQMCRIYNFYRRGVAIGNANENAANEARTPIFANANKRAGKVIINFTAGHHHTATERSGTGDIMMWFNDGQVKSNDSGYGAGDNKTKELERPIRACVEYTFRLDEE
jgi:hypothetical protein